MNDKTARGKIKFAKLVPSPSFNADAFARAFYVMLTVQSPNASVAVAVSVALAAAAALA